MHPSVLGNSQFFTYQRVIKELAPDLFLYIKLWYLKVNQKSDNKETAPGFSEACVFSETEVTGRFTAGGFR